MALTVPKHDPDMLAAEARACAERARFHNREKNRHRNLAREARRRQVALAERCRALGIELRHTPYHQGSGDRHGRTDPRSQHRR